MNALTEMKPAAGEKSELILDAAIKLFRHYGYRRTSMEDIAREAGVAKGTLYLYFESKDQLFRSLTDQLKDNVVAAIEAAMAAGGSVGSRIEGVLLAKYGFYYEWVLSSPHAAEIIGYSKELQEGNHDARDDVCLTHLRELMDEGERSDVFDLAAAGLDADGFIELLLATAFGIAGREPALKDYGPLLSQAVRVLVKGVEKRA